MFDKIHGVYENQLQQCSRRTRGKKFLLSSGPYLHTGYILFQLLRLLGKEVRAEEFNTLKTLELAITNDRIWAQVCAALGWKYLPTV